MYHIRSTYTVGHKNMVVNLSTTATLRFCKVVWRRYRGKVVKFYRTLWLILSKTLHINSYQNHARIVEVMTKNFGVFFMPHSVLVYTL